LVGATHGSATDAAACKALCSSTSGCTKYSYCTDVADCGIFANTCGMIDGTAPECKLVTSLGRDKLSTYQLYDAKTKKMQDHAGFAFLGAGFVAGLVVMGGVALFIVRMRRRSDSVSETEQDLMIE